MNVLSSKFRKMLKPVSGPSVAISPLTSAAGSAAETRIVTASAQPLQWDGLVVDAVEIALVDDVRPDEGSGWNGPLFEPGETQTGPAANARP